ncbi:MAG: orotidine-5'-phosphate decarboxylase [Gammaproteobacteria bacterium]|nr:orotidine-5'-phosphate decarboxylase [Gammaproteobacteria bacterium]
MTKDQIILALDVPTADEALVWMERMKSHIGCFKIGLQLFCAHGPELVRQASELGTPVFLDLKLHDIPNTVASAIKSLHGLDIKFLTIHTQGGPAMIEAAREAIGDSPTQLLGVTILTSLDDPQVSALGYSNNASDQAIHLATMAGQSGLDGFVCSPLEAAAIRDAVPGIKALVTPGVRPAGADQGDQSRVTTPEQAITNGATHVVIGRPILNAENPEAVAQSLLD